MTGASLDIPTFAVGTRPVCEKKAFAVAEKLSGALHRSENGAELLSALPSTQAESPVPVFPEGVRSRRTFRFSILAACHNAATVYLRDYGIPGNQALAQVLNAFSDGPPWGRLAVLGAARAYHKYPRLLCRVVVEGADDTRLNHVRFTSGGTELGYEHLLSSKLSALLASWGISGRHASRDELKDIAEKIATATRAEAASAISRFVDVYRDDLRLDFDRLPSNSTVRSFVEGLSEEGFERIRAAGNEGSRLVLDEITFGEGQLR